MNCKWLPDEYLHIADACPYDKGEQEECRFYEEEK